MSSSNDSELYRAAVETAARENGVDPDLIMRMIQQESLGDPHAVSSKGARGLMQLMPDKLATYGVTDVFDPVQNVTAGTKLMRELLDKYHGDQRLALLDYNGGPDAVAAYQAGKPFKESAGFLKGIMGDSDRPAPFDLAGFVKAHDVPEQQFDLKSFVKAHEPTWSERAVTSLGDVATGLKNAAVETNPVTPIVDFAKGAGKGALETAVDLAQTAHNIPAVSSLTGLTPEDFDRPEVRQPLEVTKGKNLLDVTPQQIGKFVERGAEFAVPGAAADEAVLGAARNVPALLRLVPRALAQAGVGATEAGVHGENPVVGGTIAATGPVLGETAAALSPLIKAAGTSMVRTSLKPAYSLLSHMGGFEGAAPNADELVAFIVKHNLASPIEAEAFIKALEREKIIPITARATRAGVTVPKAATEVTKAIQDYGAAPSLAPEDVQAAAEKTMRNVQKGALYKDQITPGAPVPVTSPIAGPTGQPVITMQPGPNVVTRVPNPDLTPDDLLNAARNTKFTETTTGTKLSPQDEVNNLLVVKARNELKDAVPDLRAPFEEERMAINAKKALDRSSVREGNNANVPLKAAVVAAGGHPVGAVYGIGATVLKLVGGVKAGLLANQLGQALERQDPRSVLSLIRMMGYGAAIDALPKQE